MIKVRFFWHIIVIAFNLFGSKKIVGLTASVGVGKAKNEEKAMDWIFSMMANMDAEELCVVEENKAELAQHVNIPDQGRIIMILFQFISIKIALKGI